MDRNDILLFINLITSTFGNYKKNSEGCFRFYRILKFQYPDVVGYYNSNHVITKIGEVFYDQNGIVENIEGYLPMTEYGVDYFEGAFQLTTVKGFM